MSEKEFLSQLKEHQNIIYKLVHLYANTTEDKKDMYQEIVLQAWKSFPAFRGEAKFSTWLYRLCINTILTLKRKTNRIEYTDTVAFEETYFTTAGNEEIDRLYKSIRTLPETDRAIISLHLDGYDNKEISELLGITANGVGVKIHRIKQQLAILLKDI
ncbi:MAG: sigma-70 family RNA polymerase sigma factor [Ferruginibacter sp.]